MKIAAHKVRKGDMVSLITGGGGGWGTPAKRDPERVLWDVKNEYVTLEDARDIYGVAIDGKTLELNQKETEKLRKAKKV
jgi:N-methylhydantoinase B